MSSSDAPLTPTRTLGPIALTLMAATLAGIWLTSYLTLGQLELPPRAPAWFELGLAALALDALMLAVTRLIHYFVRRRPTLVNIPDRDLFLRLDETARLRAMRPAFEMIAGLGIIANLFLWGLVFDLQAIATNDERPPQWVVAAIFIPTFFGWMIVSIVRVRSSVRREGEQTLGARSGLVS
jgi:hypothetical protein